MAASKKLSILQNWQNRGQLKSTALEILASIGESIPPDRVARNSCFPAAHPLLCGMTITVVRFPGQRQSAFLEGQFLSARCLEARNDQVAGGQIIYLSSFSPAEHVCRAK